MNGLELTVSANKQAVTLEIEPLLVDRVIEAKTLLQFIKNSEYSNYYFIENNIAELAAQLKDAIDNVEMDSIKGVVAETKDAVLDVYISGDKMNAELTISSAYEGKTQSVEEILEVLNQHDVIRGVSKKRIQDLVEKASHSEPGTNFVSIVAKGLPSRSGKNSRIKIVVASALERILAPKDTDEKVDMRDFGDVYCVVPDQVLAKRMPPTSGRTGYTVSNKIIPTEAGNWLAIKLGDNVYIDPENKDIVKAKIAGLPHSSVSTISVSDVLVSKGVNVATGHITFDGSIIVNGDITEKMRVIAKGDVTVNGFVESAHIEAGGDVIITQGASGKLQEVDCTIKAKGSVYVEHAQGVNVRTKGNLNVGKQLTYSKVQCEGKVTIGSPRRPQGKLIACTMQCADSVTAGYIGAVSGSKLMIDYTDAYIQLAERYQKINAHFEELIKQNTEHELKVSTINNRKPNAELAEKLASLNNELALERIFLNWMRINRDECKEKLDTFYEKALVVANNTVFAGVTVKLNNYQWLAEADHERCMLLLENKKWQRIPVVTTKRLATA